MPKLDEVEDLDAMGTLTQAEIIAACEKYGFGNTWDRLATDPGFDQVFNERANTVTAFIYDGRLYQELRHAVNVDDTHTEILEYILHAESDFGNAMNLYHYSQGLASNSLWTLFQYLIGTSVTTQGQGLNSLLPITTQDARFLSEALLDWRTDRNAVEALVELIMIYGGE